MSKAVSFRSIPTLEELWHDPVWSKVIAGVILTAIGLVVTYFLDWWKTIGHLLKATIDFFSATSSVPNWILSILVLVFLASAAVVVAVVWTKAHRKAEVGETAWKAYRADTFFGIVWRWRYSYHGEIEALTTYCPTCDYQVFLEEDHVTYYSTRMILKCDSCGYRFADIQGPRHELESKVQRLIQQKIRQGTWPAPGTGAAASG